MPPVLHLVVENVGRRRAEYVHEHAKTVLQDRDNKKEDVVSCNEIESRS